MNPSPLSPADRATFSRWAAIVSAFYALVTVLLTASIVHDVRTRASDEVSGSIADTARHSSTLAAQR